MTFDTYEEIKDYLRQGIISATISQDVSGQLKKAFEALVGHIIIGQQPPKTIYTDAQLVLKSNMHLF